MAIVAVFCIGLIKLSWSNRLLKKQEDEESRAGFQDRRRTSMSSRRGNDIPFGVRAIQSGVEVQGIWVSRPATPDEVAAEKYTLFTDAVGVSSETKEEEAFGNANGGYGGGTAPEKPTARNNASELGTLQWTADANSLRATPLGAPPASLASQPISQQKQRAADVLSEDVLRRLESPTRPKLIYDTYIPTSTPRDLRQPSQWSSASSSGESVDSRPRSARSASGKSYASSHQSSRLYVTRSTQESMPGYDHSGAHARSLDHDRRDPFETPTRTPSGLMAFSRSDTNASLLATSVLPIPEPTFGPGDVHINRSSRRVNTGFEILPAGTFGVPYELASRSGTVELDSAVDTERGHRNSRLGSKLRKNTVTQLLS